MWRVFIGPRRTVFVGVGSGRPPTSLVVRVQPTVVEVSAGQPARPSPSAPSNEASRGTGGQAGTGGPRSTTKPAAQRRPDPPHGTAATAAGSGSGGPLTGGTASGGTTGAGFGTGAGTSTGAGTGSGDSARP